MKKVVCSLFIILSIFMMSGCRNREYWITDQESLYDVAVQYLIDHDDNPEKNRDRYQLFIDYDGFGISENENYRYAYLWVAQESYYVENQKIMSSSGSSMPYKFTFELKVNRVVRYEVPENGSLYEKSIRKMFPDDLENKVLEYTWKDDSLLKEVRDYYSDLIDKSIYYYTGEEFIKLDK